MLTIKRTSLPVLLILLGVLACALPAVPPVYTSDGGTSVAQTVESIIHQTENAAGVVDVSSDTPAAPSTSMPAASQTFTLPPPVFTPTSTLSPTPVWTVTPIVPMISVSVPTNCRVGPGKVYDQVGALMVGETVQVYARDPAGNYWYIRNPDSPSQFCWVWGEYATVTGLFTALPVYTPPPSPTPTITPTPSPAFEASYMGVDSCSGWWWVDIKLKNTGLITFKSISMTVTDTNTSTVAASVNDGFTDRSGCDSTSKSNLVPGKNATVSSPQLAYDPTDHKLKITMTVCSSTGLNGTCVTQLMTVKP